MSAPSEVLEDAGDYIEKNGWIQGELFDHDTRSACSIGALQAAVGVDFNPIRTPVGLDWGAYKGAVEGLREFIGGFNIPYWNDQPGRTKQEVLDALRGAAKQERLKEEGLL